MRRAIRKFPHRDQSERQRRGMSKSKRDQIGVKKNVVLKPERVGMRNLMPQPGLPKSTQLLDVIEAVEVPTQAV